MNISIKAPIYVCQWAYFHFGNPINLIKNSPESNLLKMLLEKIPEDYQLNESSQDNLIIQIPWSKSKDPRVYNYLNPKSKQTLASMFSNLFDLSLIRDMRQIENVSCNQTVLLEAWMLKNGIDIELDDTLRKRFYRLRKKYHEKEINI